LWSIVTPWKAWPLARCKCYMSLILALRRLRQEN
jgi:hypothetical protein